MSPISEGPIPRIHKDADPDAFDLDLHITVDDQKVHCLLAFLTPFSPFIGLWMKNEGA